MEKYLYYQDQYLREFKADIIDIITKDHQYHLELNRTAFYPEGGGQPADRGFIQDLPVQEVYKKDDKVFHVRTSCRAKRLTLSDQLVTAF